MNTTAITAENTRALGAESANVTAINTERTRATTAEGILTDNLAAEVIRATNAEATKEILTNKSTSVALDGDSDIKYSTPKSVKTYVDNIALTINSNVTALNTLENGKLYVGNINNIATEVSVSGDATMNNSGNLTIGTNAITTTKIADGNVTNTKLQNSSVTINGNTVSLGGSTTITASPVGTTLASANVLVGSASNVAAAVAMSGDVTIDNLGATSVGASKITTTKIADLSITDGKLDKANIPLSGFGPAAADVALGNKKLTGVADPTSAQDAATKAYVDTNVGALNTLANGMVYVGNASNVATEVPVSGDATMSNLGVVTIGTSKVTTDKIATENVTTDKLANLSVTGAKIAASTVTNDKLLNSSLTINGTAVSLGGTATITASPIGTTLTSGNVLVGSASNAAASVAMTGDVTIDNAGVTTIGTSRVTTDKILNAAVTTDKLANLSVTTDKITNTAVTADKLANNAVTTAKILDAAVTTDKILDSAVTTTKILNANVTTEKLANNAVITAKIADLNVTNAKLQYSSVTINGTSIDLGTSATITASPVGTALISGNVLVGSASNVAAAVSMSGDVTIDNVGATAIGTSKVTNTKIADAAVTNIKLDKANIPLSGFGPAAVDVALGNKKLIGVADPTNAQDAATKTYVDLTNTALTSEISRATAAEGTVAANLLLETTRATNAEILKENAVNKSTDGTMATNSDVKFPTEKAVRTYVSNNSSITSIRSISANYSVTMSDYTILCDNSSGTFTLTLPTPSASNTGKIFVICKIDDSSNLLSFSPALRFSLNTSIPNLNYTKTFKVQSDGASWFIIN